MILHNEVHGVLVYETFCQVASVQIYRDKVFWDFIDGATDSYVSDGKTSVRFRVLSDSGEVLRPWWTPLQRTGEET